MERQRGVACRENEELAAFIWRKRQEMADRPKGISENLDMTLYKAYSSICDSKTPITDLRGLAQIKGVGKWILRLTRDFFRTDSGASENEQFPENKNTRRYMPQKNSVAYALLITLYRGTQSVSDFMRKQELIEAAEASGLSRASIALEKGGRKPGQFGSSPKDWYTGWSCMKTLVNKGLVVKSSCPAKYMLTEEGKEAARQCLSRSGLVDSTQNLDGFSNSTSGLVDSTQNFDRLSNSSSGLVDLTQNLVTIDEFSNSRSGLVDLTENLDRFSNSDRLQPVCSSRQKKKNPIDEHVSSTLFSNLDRPPPVCSSGQKKKKAIDERVSSTLKACSSTDYPVSKNKPIDEHVSSTLKACSSTDYPVSKKFGEEAKSNVLAMPPLRFGERFEDAYEVVMILDNREHFATRGSRGAKIIENICSRFKILVEVRRLPVGDVIWIARHKHNGKEYVLDFIVERKKVDDLRSSIRDNRYRDQKLRLLRCGLKKMMYLVEGDPNSSEAAESIKTACFTTEILEGFDVQRTSGLNDTMNKYGFLTQSITEYYKSLDVDDDKGNCPSFNEFIRRCQDSDKMTVSDVFAVQLMQVSQVTEEVAIAVMDLYPTLFSLAHAYSRLDGNIAAQEELLWRQSNNVVSTAASRNIFRLIWAN